MKYIPKAITENVNVMKVNPLQEFFVLIGGILGSFIVIYLVLGFTLDKVIENMPARLERTFSNLFSQAYGFKKTLPIQEQTAQNLLDQLIERISPKDTSDYTVHIVKEPVVNAVALPGGNIVLFSGLMEQVKSENELSMVLAHELGHFAHRDHLRGLGRGAVLVLLSSLFLGMDNSLTNFLMNILVTADLKHSREQEIMADQFALDLLEQRYGHVGGAIDFFERLREKEKLPHLLAFFATHPHQDDRVYLVNQRIQNKGYAVRETIAFHFVEEEKI